MTVALDKGTHLVIDVLNSPTATLPDVQRRAKAQEIARAAYRACHRRGELASVGVAFVRVKEPGDALKLIDASTDFRFEPRELAQ